MKKQLKDVLHYYLGTGLRIQRPDNRTNKVMMGLQLDTIIFDDYSYGDAGSLLNKPNLRPLSSLTKEIIVDGYNDGKPFVPVEYFEIGEENNVVPEQDFGNIKLIKDLEEIAKHEIYHDIKFLPFWVIELLLKWHFNIWLEENDYIKIDN